MSYHNEQEDEYREISSFSEPKKDIIHICKEPDSKESICGKNVGEWKGTPVTEQRYEFWNHLTTSDKYICEDCKFKTIIEWK